MKAITLHQPYASLIATHRKRYETRSWPPPAGMINQRIGIHAGKRKSRDVQETIQYFHGPHAAVTFTGEHEIRSAVGCESFDYESFWVTERGQHAASYPLGVMVCTAVLWDAGKIVARAGQCGATRNVVLTIDWLGNSQHQVPADDYGWYEVGRWVWMLGNVEVCHPPVPAKGRQGIWEWSP